MALRFDIAKLEDPKIDHNGYLQAEAVLTRTGVFKYRRADGSVINELRSPEDVMNQDSLDTLENRPFTDGHPIVGRLDATNTRQLSRGMVISKAVQDGDLVKAKILVTDQVVIDKIMRKKNPLREVSCGYKTDITDESGEFNGERFDTRQTKIIYNHVALVPKGRAGAVARLRVDAEDGAVEGIDLELNSVNTSDNEDFPNKQHESKEDHAMTIKIKRSAITLATFKQDAFEVVVDNEDTEKSVAPALEKLDAAIDHIKKLEEKVSLLQGRNDELVEKAELPPERLDELGQERADILGVAHHVGLTNIDSLRNDEIKKMVVHKINPQLKLDDLDQPYINGRYDSVIDNIKKNNKAVKSLSQLRQITRSDDYQDGAEEDTRSPRDKFIQDGQDMWMSEEEKKQLHG